MKISSQGLGYQGQGWPSRAESRSRNSRCQRGRGRRRPAGEESVSKGCCQVQGLSGGRLSIRVAGRSRDHNRRAPARGAVRARGGSRARRVRSSHGRACFDSRGAQSSATESGASGRSRGIRFLPSAAKAAPEASEFSPVRPRPLPRYQMTPRTLRSAAPRDRSRGIRYLGSCLDRAGEARGHQGQGWQRQDQSADILAIQVDLKQ